MRAPHGAGAQGFGGCGVEGGREGKAWQGGQSGGGRGWREEGWGRKEKPVGSTLG